MKSAKSMKQSTRETQWNDDAEFLSTIDGLCEEAAKHKEYYRDIGVQLINDRVRDVLIEKGYDVLELPDKRFLRVSWEYADKDVPTYEFLKEFYNENRIAIMQYESLRKHFRQMIEDVLGKGYYNMGGDVYECDRITCEDITNQAKKFKWFR